ncbi:vWA domain-containing protein, partial [Oleiphilus sp. HI0123]
VFVNVLISANAFAQDAAANEAGADIRMLIDISGSMKKNDPANLRIPAVNLLTELIPDGDEAGVWTFGQWVNNLVKLKAVDEQWRLDAKEKAKKINSVALYTNIGAVLEKASDDFYKEGKDFSNTHFILLTDGMVDIDKDPEKN